MQQMYEESYFVASSTGGYADYLADEALHRLNAHDRLARIENTGTTPGRILDVGCAAGFFLDAARHAGWQVLGLDCSEWARRIAERRFGLPVLASWPDEESDEPRQFDTISMFQVLEHLVHPDQAIAAAASRLAPGGIVVVETWNRRSVVARLCGKRWQQMTPPSVVHLFSNDSLKLLVESKGFANIEIRSTSKRVSAEFIGNLLRAKYPRLLAPLGWATSKTPIGRFSFPYSLGDLVTLTARKPA